MPSGCKGECGLTLGVVWVTMVLREFGLTIGVVWVNCVGCVGQMGGKFGWLICSPPPPISPLLLLDKQKPVNKRKQTLTHSPPPPPHSPVSGQSPILPTTSRGLLFRRVPVQYSGGIETPLSFVK